MKKTYIIPDMTIVMIKTSNVMNTASWFEGALDNDGDSGDGALSRESWWDDDTEEDDFYADRY